MSARVMLVLPTETYRATAFLRAAAVLGLEVVVASNEAPTLATLMRGHVLTLDLQAPSGSADRASDFNARWPVDAVIGVDEASVITAAHVAERVHMKRRNPVAAVQATRDKRLLRQRLTEAGLQQPRFVATDVDATDDAVAEALTVVGLPCVIKPVDLAASRGVIRADTHEGAVGAVRRTGELLRTICTDGSVPPLVIEGYVGGAEVADGTVLDPEGRGQDGDGGEPAVPGVREQAHAGQRRDGADDQRFGRERAGQPAAQVPGGQVVGRPAARERAEHEPGDGDDGGRGGQARAGVGGEAQEHDVAGHVGHEHVAQPQVADRVHETGHEGQGQQRGHGLAAAERGGDGHGSGPSWIEGGRVS